MKATAYDRGRYLVTSESEPDHEYLVDLYAWKCSCVDFGIRVEARHEKPECKHFAVAFEQCGRDFIAEVKAYVKSKKKPFSVPVSE